MPIDFDSVRQNNVLHDVASAYIPDLKKQGSEYVGLCPFHDDHDPSLSIYQADGGYERYHCHACRATGDVIDFIKDIRNCDVKEAIQWLENGHVPAVSEQAIKKKPGPKKAKKCTPIVPAPDDAPKYDPRQTYNPKRGRVVSWTPTMVDPYYDAEGKLHYYVVRLDLGIDDRGKSQKTCMTVCFAENQDGEKHWSAFRPPAPHILQNLDLLAKFPDRAVLVVSGEKCVRAAEELNKKNGFIPVSWMGGDQAVDKTDWTPLAGRNVVFFPDADDSGKESMSRIPELVGSEMKSARNVSTKGLPKGCDIADIITNGHKGKDLIKWFKERVQEGPVPLPAHLQRQQEGNEVTDKGKPPIKENKPASEAVGSPAKSNVVPLKKAIEIEYGSSVIDYSDQYNMARFRAAFEGRVMYVPEWKSSMIWDDDTAMWTNELTNPLMSFVGSFLNELAREASVRYDLEKEAKSAAKRMSSFSAVSAMVQMIRQDQFFRAGSGTFDTNPYEIGVPGGVVNLETGQLRPRRPEDRISKCTTVAPASGRPERFLKFLLQVMGGDEEMVDYLQKMCGYFLTGDTTESQWYFLYGSGRNGKSTLLNLVGEIMGDYYKAGQTETFMQSYGDRHPADVAALQGARLVTAMEVPDNKTWNVVRIKQMTGGDPVTARMMRGNDFSYIPQYKLVFTGNDLPRLRGVDEALRRRLHLIPFDVTITADEEDKSLPGHLRKVEAPMILNWMIEGAQKWFKSRIKAPARVREATDEYLDDSDIIKQFIEQEFEEGIGYEETTQDVYQRFRDFTENANEWQGRQRWLTSQLKKRGYSLRRTTLKNRSHTVLTGFRLVHR